ncbi:kinase-like protein [Hypomontagnella monticulosa]|nr:kinase-like protein [Hypomontagnella monticulosa]
MANQGLRDKFLRSNQYRRSTKIIEILCKSGCSEDDILKVLDDGFTDIYIPVPMRLLSIYLGPSDVNRFKSIESKYLTDTVKIGEEGKPREHAHLKPEAVHKPTTIPHSLKTGRAVGSGGQSFVTSVVARGTTQPIYALKQIDRETRVAKVSPQMKYIQGELDALRKIRHYHYVDIVGSFTTSHHVGILISPLAECNLGQFLDGYTSDKASTLAGFFGCLATGLYKLHYTYKIRHKDIKPANILISDNRILLADFGIALDWGEKGRTTTQEETFRSPDYCAPEVASDQKRGSGSDIWSLGCVFLEMVAVLKGQSVKQVKGLLRKMGTMSGKYHSNYEGVLAIISELEHSNSHYGNEPLNWIRSMLKIERADRCNAGQLLDLIQTPSRDGRYPYCGQCCRQLSTEDSDDDDTFGDITQYQEELDEEEPVRVYDSYKLTWHDGRMVRHGESRKNWISPRFVKQCHLRTYHNRTKESIVIGGARLESTEYVEAIWELQDKGIRTEKLRFLVSITDPPFDILVGSTSSSSLA